MKSCFGAEEHKPHEIQKKMQQEDWLASEPAGGLAKGRAKGLAQSLAKEPAHAKGLAPWGLAEGPAQGLAKGLARERGKGQARCLAKIFAGGPARKPYEGLAAWLDQGPAKGAS